MCFFFGNLFGWKRKLFSQTSGTYLETWRLEDSPLHFHRIFLPIYLLMRFSLCRIFVQLCGAQGAIFGVDVHQVLSNALVSLRASATEMSGSWFGMMMWQWILNSARIQQKHRDHLESYLLLVEEILHQLIGTVVYPSTYQALYIPGTVKPYNKKLSQSCQTLANFLPGRVPLRNFSRAQTLKAHF